MGRGSGSGKSSALQPAAPGALIQSCIKSTILVVYLAGLNWASPLGHFEHTDVLLPAVHFLIYQ